MITQEYPYLEIQNNIGIIWLDKPNSEANILTIDVLDHFVSIIDKIENDSSLIGGVIISKKKSFMAGADIKAFVGYDKQEAKEAALAGHSILKKIEDLSKPVVVAIHGFCMGGGTELSLACKGRVASDDPSTIMALPEVKLGLLPGMGGTVRLPRLVGLQNSLDIMLTGKNIFAGKAKKIGLVDKLVDKSKLLDSAKQLVESIASKKFKRKDKRTAAQKLLESNPITKNVIYKEARKAVMRQTRGNYPAPLKIIESVKFGLANKRDIAIENEVNLFSDLMVSPESAELIQIFLGMTELKKNPLQDKVKKVDNISVLGAGLMGEGIAEVSVNKGYDIVLKDISDESLEKAHKNLWKSFNKKVKRRILKSVDAETKMNKIAFTKNYEGFNSTDLVIEAVFEDLNIKHKVIQELEENISEETIVATNTSALPIADVAKGSKNPENVIGMHYFSPVPKMPLLEIIKTDKTADWVTATALDVGIKQGKTCIVVKDGPGFYTTRILAPFINEALLLMEEGVPPLQIDKAMKDFGYPVGPITLIDEVGIDVGAHIMKGGLKEMFDKREVEISGVLLKMFEKGYKGRKNNKGFLKYEKGKKIKGKLDEGLNEFFTFDNTSVSDELIQQRMASTMVLEAVYCLDEIIIESPRDGDIGAIFGLGFPPFLGGPFRYIDGKGLSEFVKMIGELEKGFGKRFKSPQMLEDMKNNNSNFY